MKKSKCISQCCHSAIVGNTPHCSKCGKEVQKEEKGGERKHNAIPLDNDRYVLAWDIDCPDCKRGIKCPLSSKELTYDRIPMVNSTSTQPEEEWKEELDVLLGDKDGGRLNIMVDFISSLLSQKDKEWEAKQGKWIVCEVHGRSGQTTIGEPLYWAKVKEIKPTK
jgi:hypothetical protein